MADKKKKKVSTRLPKGKLPTGVTYRKKPKTKAKRVGKKPIKKPVLKKGTPKKTKELIRSGKSISFSDLKPRKGSTNSKRKARKLKAAAKKTVKVNKTKARINKKSSKLRKELGDKKYEQLRTGKAKGLSKSQKSTVSTVNRLKNKVDRKKKAIAKKVKKANTPRKRGIIPLPRYNRR